jgi:hypothetical protein
MKSPKRKRNEMPHEEKLARAEKFVRETAAALGTKVSDVRIREAAVKAAKALPPFGKAA